MKNFLVVGLSTEQKNKIDPDNKLIEFNSDNYNGLFFDNERKLNDAITVLGLAGKYSTRDCSTEGLFILDFRMANIESFPPIEEDQNISKKYDITFVSSENINSGLISTIKSVVNNILIPVVNKNVIIDVPHNMSSSHKSAKDRKNNFYIKVWSTPNDFGSFIIPPQTIFGRKIDCRDHAYQPTYRGKIITDNNFDLAELFPDELYIHYDSVHSGSADEANIFKKTIEIAVRYMKMTMDEINNEKEAFLLSNVEAEKANFIKKAGSFTTEKIKKTKKDIILFRKESEEHKSEYIKKIRDIQTSEQIVSSLQESRKTSKKEFITQFDRITSIPKVSNISITADKIFVYTEELLCKNPVSVTIHKIGKFKIIIDFVSSEVLWFNLTRIVDGYKKGMQAPQVFPHGLGHLGNFEENFTQMFANYDFESLIKLSIQFIENIDADNSLCKYIKYWPKVE